MSHNYQKKFVLYNLLTIFLFFIITINAKADLKINTDFTCTYTTSDNLRYIGYLPGNPTKPSDVTNEFPFKFGNSDEYIELRFKYDEKEKNYKVDFSSSSVYENNNNFLKTDVMIGYYDGEVHDNSVNNINVPASFIETNECPKRISLATYCERGDSTDGQGCLTIRPYIMMRNDENNELYTSNYKKLNPSRFYHSKFKKHPAGGYIFEELLYGNGIESEDRYIIRTYIDNPEIKVKESKVNIDNITIDECCDSAKKSQVIGSGNLYDEKCKSRYGNDYKKQKCGIQNNTNTGKLVSNSKTGKIYNKQCEYTGRNDTTGATGQVYFYESYNWYYTSYESDPVNDHGIYIEEEGGKKYTDKFKSNIGEWKPVRQASFAKNIKIFDSMSEEIKKYVDKNYECNAENSCSDKTYQEKFVEMAYRSSINVSINTPYKYFHSLLLNGDLRDAGMEAVIDVGSYENTCITYNNKPWAPDEFYGCQVSQIKIEDSDIFSVFDSSEYDGGFYLFSNKADMEMMCPKDVTSDGLYYYRYTFNNKKDPYVYRLTQDVELSCEFTQDFFKNAGVVGKGISSVTKFLGFSGGKDKAEFSFVFTKDGKVESYRGKGVSNLDIKFLLNKEQIMDLYNIKSSTDVLQIDSLKNLMMFTTDLGTAEAWKLKTAIVDIAISAAVAIIGGAVATTLKIPKFAVTTIKYAVKIVSIAFALSAGIKIIDYMHSYFTKRNDRTVILTNTLNLSNEDINAMKKELTKDGVSAFEAFRLENSKDSFKCTVSPYTKNNSSIGNLDVNCETILDGDFGKILKYILNIIRFIACTILILFSVMDFVKPILSGDDEMLKKSGRIFIKRLIIFVLILFLPVLIELLLSLIDKTSCRI